MKKRKAKSAKSANGRNGKATQKKQALSVEITGVLLIFLALFAVVSVISFDPKDPSFATSPTAGHTIRNFAGSIGSYFAQAYLWFLGLAAYLLPFILGYAALRAVMRGSSAHLLKRLGTITLGLMVVCPLLALIFESFPVRGSTVPAGGLLGELLLNGLVRFLGTIGSFIFLLAALAAFLLFSTRWSLAKTLRFAKGAFESTAKEVRIQVTDRQKAKEKDRMREKVRDKYAAPPAVPDPKSEKAARKAEKEAEREREREERRAAKEAARKPIVAAPLPRKPVAPPKPEPLLFPDPGRKGDYLYPHFNLLEIGLPAEKISQTELLDKKKRIEEKLKEFGIEGEVREYHPGPIITTYEYFPAPGVKVSQVQSRTEDLALALETESVRIQRIAGKSTLGIEIPNNKREIIKLRDIIESPNFQDSPSKLTFALGKDVHGGVVVTDLAVMPHLLIAGSTGTGKSVALNALIASLLYKATPEEVKIVLIDPKRLEFTLFEDIPHLLCPVINDPKKAHIVLNDIVKKMEERYKKLQGIKVRNIDQYNTQMKQLIAEKKGALTEEEKQQLQPLPYIVIIIDELAELMMVGAQDVEFLIGRLAQLARAVGIHLVMATAPQSPARPPSLLLRFRGRDQAPGQARQEPGHADLRHAHPPRRQGRRRSRGRRGRREGRALRQGRRDRPAERPGLGLPPPAPPRARLRPGGPDHRPDGRRGPHRPQGRQQAARDPHRPQGVLQGADAQAGRRRGQGPGRLSRMIKEDRTAPPEDAVLQYRPVISFRVRKALGSSNPDWEDVVNEILTQAV
ncbi:MAG: spoIIIE, partial [Candidatus Aminicenantes bacterium]|nr:spoIIIE [Candidatus Aminicenantes bacterium]